MLLQIWVIKKTDIKRTIWNRFMGSKYSTYYFVYDRFPLFCYIEFLIIFGISQKYKDCLFIKDFPVFLRIYHSLFAWGFLVFLWLEFFGMFITWFEVMNCILGSKVSKIYNLQWDFACSWNFCLGKNGKTSHILNFFS